MNTYKKYCKKAEKLVEKLALKVKNNPSIICENYGQKEIRKMINEIEGLNYGILSYIDKCNIKNILYQVSSIC